MRISFIKARPVLGDLRAAGRFLKALVPFVWRRSLDYAAVLDIQAIKRQIHVHKTGEGLAAAGANLKLGRGGIREIEFYAQTQQLILGGRDPTLRKPRTLEALDKFGVPPRIASFVLPLGYSFNLDGTAIYLTMASLFVASAMGKPLSIGEQIGLLAFMIIASKGAAAPGVGST